MPKVSKGKYPKCSVCGGEFDIEGEGGVEGDIGIIPAAFCVWCFTGILDMMDKTRCNNCSTKKFVVKQGKAKGVGPWRGIGRKT